MSETLAMDCNRRERWLEAYVDDELDAVHVLVVEEHIAECEGCREQLVLTRAMRASLRRTVTEGASHGLRERLRAVLAVEKRLIAEEEEAAPQSANPRSANEAQASPRFANEAQASPRFANEAQASPRFANPQLVSLRYVMPLVLAASIAFFLGSQRLSKLGEPDDPTRRAELRSDASSATVASAFDRYLDDLVLAHAQPVAPEVPDLDGLAGLDLKVGVRLPRPELSQLGMRYIGARLHRDAALMQFRGDRNRVTLYVFDPARIPMQANRLSPRTIGSTRLYVGRVRGYAVAASERDGVGYALASDFGDEESARVLIQAAAR